MLELSGREFLITDGLEKQLSVPYISQEGSFPNGCESVSAVMLLRYYGFDITPDEFIDSYLPCEPVRISWGTRYETEYLSWSMRATRAATATATGALPLS